MDRGEWEMKVVDQVLNTRIRPSSSITNQLKSKKRLERKRSKSPPKRTKIDDKKLRARSPYTEIQHNRFNQKKKLTEDLKNLQYKMLSFDEILKKYEGVPDQLVVSLSLFNVIVYRLEAESRREEEIGD